MNCDTCVETAGTPREFRLPSNVSLPYIYNWNSYAGLPELSTEALTWTSFPAGEPTAFLISAATKEEINNPAPLNGQPVPRPADIHGNPVDINIYSSKQSRNPFDVAVSLVPQNTGPTPHVHWSDYEWFYVLSGSITLYVSHDDIADGVIPGENSAPLAEHLYEIKVDAGQMVYGPSNMIHSFTNYSEEPATWLTIWRRDQSELKGGISQFFTRGDIAPLVLDYNDSVKYYQDSDFVARVTHWAETFPLYNVTISPNFGSYTTSGQFDPNHPNQPGPDHPNVIVGAPQDVLDQNNEQELRSLFQGFNDLLVGVQRGRRAISIKSANRVAGLPTNLELSRLNHNGNVAEYGYFLVDNGKGDINGISSTSPLYPGAARQRMVSLFSDSSRNDEYNNDMPLGRKTISVETGQFLAFYCRDTQGRLTFSTTKPSFFNLVNASGSFDPGNQKVAINARLKGPIATLNDTISGHNDSFQYPLLDSRPLARRNTPIISKSTVIADVPSDYSIGYYKIADPSGAVTNDKGRLFSPEDPRYSAIALRKGNQAIDLNQSLNSALKSGQPVVGSFDGGELYAPFVKVKSTNDNTYSTYFAFSEANPCRSNSLTSLGTNSFGFRRSSASPFYDNLIVSDSYSLNQPAAPVEQSSQEQRIEIQNYGVKRGALVFYQADPITGALSNGLRPGDQGYVEAAYSWGRRHDTVITYNNLPANGDAKTFTDTHLNSKMNYGLLYVLAQAGSVDSRFLSSYSTANPSHKPCFAAYAGVDNSHAYGLDTSNYLSGGGMPSFNDLYLTSNVDNITIFS